MKFKMTKNGEQSDQANEVAAKYGATHYMGVVTFSESIADTSDNFHVFRKDKKTWLIVLTKNKKAIAAISCDKFDIQNKRSFSDFYKLMNDATMIDTKELILASDRLQEKYYESFIVYDQHTVNLRSFDLSTPVSNEIAGDVKVIGVPYLDKNNIGYNVDGLVVYKLLAWGKTEKRARQEITVRLELGEFESLGANANDFDEYKDGVCATASDMLEAIGKDLPVYMVVTAFVIKNGVASSVLYENGGFRYTTQDDVKKYKL